MMFEGDEYRQYVELCRDLKLERECEVGDCWSLGPHPAETTYVEIAIWAPCDEDEGNAKPTLGDGWFWLPRLDQILNMLAAAGIPDLAVLPNDTPGWTVGKWGMGRVEPWAEGSSREEAALRLWVAVSQSSPSS